MSERHSRRGPLSLVPIGGSGVGRITREAVADTWRAALATALAAAVSCVAGMGVIDAAADSAPYRVVVQPGDVVDGVSLAQLGSPQPGEDGIALVTATSTGILRVRNGHGRGDVVVRGGDVAPGDGNERFLAFDDVQIDDDGRVLFQARTSTGSGLFLAAGGRLVPITTANASGGASSPLGAFIGPTKLLAGGDVLYRLFILSGTDTLYRWSAATGVSTPVVEGSSLSFVQIGRDGSMVWLDAFPNVSVVLGTADGHRNELPAGTAASDGVARGDVRGLLVRDGSEVLIRVANGLLRWRPGVALDPVVRIGDHLGSGAVGSIGSTTLDVDGAVLADVRIGGAWHLLRNAGADAAVVRHPSPSMVSRTLGAANATSSDGRVAWLRFDGRVVRDGRVLYDPFETRTDLGLGASVSRVSMSRDTLALAVTRTVLLDVGDPAGPRVVAGSGFLPGVGAISGLGSFGIPNLNPIFGDRPVASRGLIGMSVRLADGRSAIVQGRAGRWRRLLVFGTRRRPPRPGEEEADDVGPPSEVVAPALEIGGRVGRGVRQYSVLASTGRRLLVGESSRGATLQALDLFSRGARQRFHALPAGASAFSVRADVCPGGPCMLLDGTLYQIDAAGPSILLERGSPIPDGTGDHVQFIQAFDADATRLAVAVATEAGRSGLVLQQNGTDTFLPLDVDGTTRVEGVSALLLGGSFPIVQSGLGLFRVTANGAQDIVRPGDETPLGALNGALGLQLGITSFALAGGDVVFNVGAGVLALPADVVRAPVPPAP